MRQLRFRSKLGLVGNTERDTTIRIVELFGRHIDAGTDQCVPAGGGVRAIDCVHPIRDPARAAHVLPFGARSAFPLFLLTGLVQRHHPQRLVS